MKIRSIGAQGSYRVIAGFLFLLLWAPALQAAPQEMTQMDGDVITYTSKTGVMTARGGVKLSQGNAVITGETGDYNTKTKEAVVTGSVKLVQADSTLTAAQVRSYEGMQRLLATGNVFLTHPSGTAAGPSMEYFPENRHAKITGGARLTNKDAVLTASVAEAFLQEDRATADGNVHIVSAARKLDSVSDSAVYYGINGNNGKADLTGNVRAVQDGNVLTGNHVTLFLDDSAMNADGRAKLVMLPANKPAATSPDSSKKSKGNL